MTARRTPVVCPTCKTLHRTPNGTLCPPCRRAADRARGTTTQRGYGREHQRLRLAYARRLAQGEAIPCARCGQPIRQGDAWDLGHTDDRTSWTGPEHDRQCNRAAAGRIGAAITNSR